MRLIGPIVRNDLFFFVTMLALAGLMILMEYKRRTPAAAPRQRHPRRPPQADWSQRREKMWMSAVVGASFLFIFLSTAEFIYAKSSTALSPTTAVTLVGIAGHRSHSPTSTTTSSTATASTSPTPQGRAVEVRFLLFKKPDGNIVSVADACQICGPVGFYIGSQGITCKMCASPPRPPVHGPAWRLQPHPPQIHQAGGMLMVQTADLRTLAPVFER